MEKKTQHVIGTSSHDDGNNNVNKPRTKNKQKQHDHNIGDQQATNTIISFNTPLHSPPPHASSPSSRSPNATHQEQFSVFTNVTSSQPSAPHPSGSYIIQLPIDQVYRVPPHENAAINAHTYNENNDDNHNHNHEHNNNTTSPISPGRHKKDKVTFCLACLWVLFFLLFVVLLLFIILGILFLLLKPKNPKFHIQSFAFKNSSSLHHLATPLVYLACMNTTNPNDHIGFYYVQGSVASLKYGGVEIARGMPPPFYHSKHNSTSFEVFLWSVKKLPMEAIKSMHDSKSHMKVPLILYMQMALRLKLWSLKFFKMRMTVTCSFGITGSAKFSPAKCSIEVHF